MIPVKIELEFYFLVLNKTGYIVLEYEPGLYIDQNLRVFGASISYIKSSLVHGKHFLYKELMMTLHPW